MTHPMQFVDDISQIAKDKPGHLDIRKEVERLRSLGAPWPTVVTNAKARFVDGVKGSNLTVFPFVTHYVQLPLIINPSLISLHP